ncbi:MAG TPA: hypothetical protein VLS89_15150, partial [Candidatus Nanopelagicales bacterium]|nr:hypothetical protein [Candidatus Nanopelagicales bacterium]
MPAVWRAGLLIAASQPGPALADALDLVRRFPGRAPIEALYAYLLMGFSEPNEALPHARRAFEALPAHGNRLLLGHCLRLAGKPEEALEVLEPLAQSSEPAALHELALTTDEVRPEDAPARWERYLEGRTENASARLRLALAHARLKHMDLARELSWAAATGAGAEKLRPEEIYQCAQLQRGGETLDDQGRARLRELAERLAAHAEDPFAEQARLVLLAELDFPEDMPPVDVEALKESGLLTERLDGDDDDAALRHAVAEHEAAWSSYRAGWLPFELLCERTGTPPASALVAAARGSSVGTEPIQLFPPVERIGSIAPELTGKRLLLGELELLLVHHLGLWSRLRAAIGATGRILVLLGIAERLPLEAVRLRGTGGAAELAAAVADSIRDGIESGWIEVDTPSADASELPPLRPESDTAEARRRLWEPLRWSTSLRDPLVASPEALLVTADFYPARDPARSPAVHRLLAWPSNEAFAAWSRRMSALEPRCITLPELLRRLDPEGAARDARLTLAALGFVDALGPEDLLAFMRAHDGATQPEPARILDGLEQMARARGHRGAAEAQRALASLYAGAVWQAWCGRAPWSSAEAEALTLALLERAEILDERSRSVMVDALLHGLAASTLSTPEASQPLGEGRASYPSPYSPAGQLWSGIARWAGPRGTRRAALSRALRQVWLMLEALAARGRQDPRSALALVSATMQSSLAGLSEAPLSSLGAAFGAVLTLSAYWRESLPETSSVMAVDARSGETREIAISDILRHGVALLESGALGMSRGDDTYRFAVPVGETARTVHVAIPAEALLLRMKPEAVPPFAHALATEQGP